MIGRAVVRVSVYLFVIVACFIVGVLARGLWVGTGVVVRRAAGFVRGRRKLATDPPLRPAA
jgi:hypothetical protein